MKFKKGRLSVAETAKALQMDPQTLRVMIQQSLIPYGKAVKMPGSSRYMYIISPRAFYEATGVALGGMEDD